MGTRTFKELTTFKIGGRINEYQEVDSRSRLVELVKYAKKRNLEIFILGGGSDILVSDNDFNGLVIKYVGKKIDLTNEMVIAEAGVNWDDLVNLVVENNLQGIECLSGIPGNVGAAPIQNIGAYGQELKNTFISLTALHIDSEQYVTFDSEDCGFGYRESIFKKPENWQKYIITDVTLKLNQDTPPFVIYESLIKYLEENKIENPTLSEVRQAVLKIRESKFENPKEVGNAGSFFKNPIISKKDGDLLKLKYKEIPLRQLEDGSYKTSAGWLIEQAGWKGKSFGTAAVSPRHALILINPKGESKASDVLGLSQEIVKDVRNLFGINLESEVQFINF